jgi:hypothetical protein
MANIIDYAPIENRRARRAWMPLVLMLASTLIWYRPRLTPTFFPDLLDEAALGALLAGAFAVGYWCWIPGWATLAFGGLAVVLFLMANLDDNNFRANTRPADVFWLWSLSVAAGAIIAWIVALLGSRAADRIRL